MGVLGARVVEGVVVEDVGAGVDGEGVDGDEDWPPLRDCLEGWTEAVSRGR